MNLLTRFFSNTKVKFDVMNKLMSEIEARDDDLQNQINVRVTDTELTEFAQTVNTELLERDTRLDEINLKNIQLESKNAEQDIEIGKRVLQTDYDTKMAVLETKNTEQDNAISNKVNNSTFTAAKTALEESIATKLSKDTYAIDKAAIEETLSGKTTSSINGTQANVNFIRNEIVKDELVNSFAKYNVQASNTLNIADATSDFNVIIYNNISKTDETTSTLIYNKSLISDMRYKLVGGKYKVSCWINNVGITVNELEQDTRPLYISLSRVKDKYILSTESKLVILGTSTASLDFNNIKLGSTSNTMQGEIIVGLYNRLLTPKEIQHNFSVLNNTPSINRINDYAISTDTDHVLTRTGVTEEERYTELLKSTCKEFTSNGEAITVSNGIAKQKVLSGKIEGQTVKNYADFQTQIFPQSLTSSSRLNCTNVVWEKGKTYKVVCYIENIPSDMTGIEISANGGGTRLALVVASTLKVGINEIKFTVPSDFVQTSINSYMFLTKGNTTPLVLRWYALLDENSATPTSSILFGLTSTQATIYNNGLKYSFYSSLEDKLAGKVIDLGRVGNVADTLEVLEDGSGVLRMNIGTHIWSDTQDILDDGTTELNHKFRFTFSKMLNGGTILACNKYNFVDWDTYSILNGIEGISCAGNNINLSVLKTYANTINELKEKLKQNPIIIYYQLATPVVTPIDKSLVPTVMTQLSNTFSFGDAVKPSKVIISVPVNKIADLETRLGQLEAVVASVSNLSLLGNYAEDEYNKEINQL